MDLSVIPIESAVLIGNSIEARVIAIAIYCGPRVQYQCVWFDGNVRRVEWLEACEVTTRSEQRSLIGFLMRTDV